MRGTSKELQVICPQSYNQPLLFLAVQRILVHRADFGIIVEQKATEIRIGKKLVNSEGSPW